MSQKYVCLNGKLVPQEDAKISVFDMGVLFGAGIYDVTYVYDGKIFDFISHVKRAQLCTSQIGLSCPFETEEIIAKANELVQKNNMTYGILYIQITFGGKIGVRSNTLVHPKLRPKDLPVTYFMFTSEMHTMQPEAFSKGVTCELCPDRRWKKCHVKTTSLIANAMAGANAVANGANEAIIYDDEKNVVLEGSATNVFCIKDGVVYTHPLEEDPEDFGRILHGVTRGHIVRLCKQNNVPLKECEFPVEFLLNADECFLSSTTKEVCPILKIDDKIIGDGKPGPVSKQLEQYFIKLVEEDTGISHPKKVLFN